MRIRPPTREASADFERAGAGLKRRVDECPLSERSSLLSSRFRLSMMRLFKLANESIHINVKRVAL